MQKRSIQRGRPKKVRPSRPNQGGHNWTGTSADGYLRYALRRTAAGLLVERQRFTAHVERAFQTISFADVASFAHWCDEDSMRYEYNQLCAVLRKRGVELFGRSTGVGNAQTELCFG